MSAKYSVEEILTIANHLDAVDATRASLVKALMAYRCIRTVDEDGEPLPLVDALSPGEGGTIQPGTEEIEYLAEYLAYEFAKLPASPAGVPDGWARDSLLPILDAAAAGRAVSMAAGDAARILRQMLAAAPSAPEGDGGGE